MDGSDDCPTGIILWRKHYKTCKYRYRILTLYLQKTMTVEIQVAEIAYILAAMSGERIRF